MTSLYLIILANILLPHKVTVVLEHRTSVKEFWRDTIQPTSGRNVGWPRKFIWDLETVGLHVVWSLYRAGVLSSLNVVLLKLMSIESVMPSNHLILLPPFPPTLNVSQHQGLFQWVGSSHQMVYWQYVICYWYGGSTGTKDWCSLWN